MHHHSNNKWTFDFDSKSSNVSSHLIDGVLAERKISLNCTMLMIEIKNALERIPIHHTDYGISEQEKRDEETASILHR